MSLTVLNMTPVDGSINIPLDSTFMVEFDGPIDPFSVPNGISLYTVSSGAWTGPDLAILDKPELALNTSQDEYLQYQIQFTIEGNRVFLKPLSALAPERTHYISVFPGSDARKTVSETTVGAPEYTRVSVSTGTIEPASSYIGDQDETYHLTILSDTTVGVSKGVVFIDEFIYEDGVPLELDDIAFLFSGTFEIGDVIDIDVFRARGLTAIFKTSFETSKYDTMSPESTSLTVPPGNILDQLKIPLKVVKTIPDNLTFNNTKINPITIKFNQALDLEQNLMDKITIKRLDMLTGNSRYINYYYKINNDILKIFMISLSK